MNTEQQRKAFLYELNGHGYHFKNTDWYDDWERFEDEQLNMVWEMWLAAQQQDGYVMVPVEPSKEKLKEIEEKCFEHPDCFGIDCPLDVIYRAIVGEME